MHRLETANSNAMETDDQLRLMNLRDVIHKLLSSSYFHQIKGSHYQKLKHVDLKLIADST